MTIFNSTANLDGKYGAQASAFAQAIANVVKNGQGSELMKVR